MTQNQVEQIIAQGPSHVRPKNNPSLPNYIGPLQRAPVSELVGIVFLLAFLTFGLLQNDDATSVPPVLPTHHRWPAKIFLSPESSLDSAFLVVLQLTSSLKLQL